MVFCNVNIFVCLWSYLYCPVNIFTFCDFIDVTSRCDVNHVTVDLYVQFLGRLCTKHQTLMDHDRPGRILRHASVDELMKPPPKPGVTSIRMLFPTWDSVTIDFLHCCLRMDPDLRSTSSTLLQHLLFAHDDFTDKFLVHLRNIIAKESATNPLMAKRLVEGKPTESEPRQLPSGISRYKFFCSLSET